MDAQTSTQTRENARLGDIANRSEKGTALTLIRAETKARDAKTARLKALRLAQEAEVSQNDAAAAAVTVKRAKTVKSTKTAKAAKPAARKKAAALA